MELLIILTPEDKVCDYVLPLKTFKCSGRRSAQLVEQPPVYKGFESDLWLSVFIFILLYNSSMLTMYTFNNSQTRRRHFDPRGQKVYGNQEDKAKVVV